MLFNPRYGRIGTLGLGHVLIVDVIGPIAETLGYILIPFFWVTGQLDFDFVLAFIALVFISGVFFSVMSLALSEMGIKRFPRTRDLIVLLLVAIIENFGYRQLNNVWRVQGYWQYLRGDNSWGEMTRRGFAKASG